MFFSSCPLKLVYLLKIPQGREKKEPEAEACEGKRQPPNFKAEQRRRERVRKKNSEETKVESVREGCEGKKNRGYEFLGLSFPKTLWVDR